VTGVRNERPQRGPGRWRKKWYFFSKTGQENEDTTRQGPTKQDKQVVAWGRKEKKEKKDE
jgi:hypothetical protein